MRWIASLLALLALIPLAACNAPSESRAPLVLAAASMQEAMSEAAEAWAGRGHERPVLSFAGSGALARQAASGAPADIFVSADPAWMDWLDDQVPLRPGSRTVLASNQLVLIAPQGSALSFPNTGEWRRAIGTGRLALANPSSVPAGRYGKAALTSLGVWEEVSARVAETADVRAALALVGRGDAPLGIVYASDAVADHDVRIVGTFPDSAHPPILYAAAQMGRSESEEAEAFLSFLHSDEGQAIFASHGFGPAPPGMDPN